MATYTIGLDFGTLSGRCVIVSVDDGRIAANVSMDYKHGVISETLPATGEALPCDFALQVPADYIEVLRYVVPEAVKESGISSDDIIGICVDFTTCTVFPVDENRKPLAEYEAFKCNKHAYCKLWKHHASQKMADRMNEALNSYPDDRVKNFGGKVSSEWLMPKLLEVYEEARDVYDAAADFTEAGDWIAALMTGVHHTGYMFAAYKGLYVEGNGYYSREFLNSLSDGFGDAFYEKHSAPVFSQMRRAGILTAEWAEKLGLKAGIAVSTSFPDAHVAPPALRITGPGVVSAIFGTSACFMVTNEEYHDVPGICGVVKDGVLPNYWGYEAGLCCYGDLFAWFCQNCVPEEYKKEAEERGLPVIKILTEKAAALKAGESGLVALDWWNGNRNILADGKLSGLIIGMTLNTKAHEIYRALLESTAFATKMIFDTIVGHGVEIRCLHAGGGIAKKDPFAMQMLADVLDLPIHVSAGSQIPATACALYAAVAAGSENGGYNTLLEAVEKMAPPLDVSYTPNKENHEIYMKLYREYAELHDFFGRGGNNIMKRLRSLSDEVKRD